MVFVGMCVIEEDNRETAIPFIFSISIRIAEMVIYYIQLLRG